ncbi:MAG: hypothetical protein EBT33_17985, partial [Betaproteobacteria bacterium]|nr:hypothetical protein [Betaproteobacteria bacterium]
MNELGLTRTASGTTQIISGSVAALNQLAARVNAVTYTGPSIALAQASSNNWPASAGQGPTSAIDGNLANKYLNYDEEGAGLILTASSASALNAIRLVTGDDFPERDPVAVDIYGATSDAAPGWGAATGWTPIVTGLDTNLPFERNASQTVSFSNTEAYRHYKVVFTKVRYPERADSVQLSEINLFSQQGLGARVRVALHLDSSETSNAVAETSIALAQATDATVPAQLAVPGLGNVPASIRLTDQQFKPLDLGPLVQAAPDAQVSLTLRLISTTPTQTAVDGNIAWVADPSVGLAGAGSSTQVQLVGTAGAINAFLSKAGTLQVRKGSPTALLEYEVRPVVVDPTTPAGAVASSFTTLLRTELLSSSSTPESVRINPEGSELSVLDSALPAFEFGVTAAGVSLKVPERFVWPAQAPSGAGLPLVLADDAISAGSGSARVFVRGWAPGPGNTAVPGNYQVILAQVADGSASFSVQNLSDELGTYALVSGPAAGMSELFARGGVRLVANIFSSATSPAPVKVEIAVSNQGAGFSESVPERFTARAIVPVQAIASTATAASLSNRVALTGTRAAIDAYLAAGNVALTAPSGAPQGSPALSFTLANATNSIESKSTVAIRSSSLTTVGNPYQLPASLPIVPGTSSPIRFAAGSFGTGTETLTVKLSIAPAASSNAVLGLLAAGTTTTTGVTVTPNTGSAVEITLTGSAAAISQHLASANALNFTGPAGTLVTISIARSGGASVQHALMLSPQSHGVESRVPGLLLPASYPMLANSWNGLRIADAAFELPGVPATEQLTLTVSGAGQIRLGETGTPSSTFTQSGTAATLLGIVKSGLFYRPSAAGQTLTVTLAASTGTATARIEVPLLGGITTATPLLLNTPAQILRAPGADELPMTQPILVAPTGWTASRELTLMVNTGSETRYLRGTVAELNAWLTSSASLLAATASSSNLSFRVSEAGFTIEDTIGVATDLGRSDGYSGSLYSPSVQIIAPGAPTQVNLGDELVFSDVVTREVFLNLPGRNISDLTSLPAYLNGQADELTLVNTLNRSGNDGRVGTAVFGERYTGYLTASFSSANSFWFKSNEKAELWVETRDKDNKAEFVLVASSDGQSETLWTRGVGGIYKIDTSSTPARFMLLRTVTQGAASKSAISYQPSSDLESHVLPDVSAPYNARNYFLDSLDWRSGFVGELQPAFEPEKLTITLTATGGTLKLAAPSNAGVLIDGATTLDESKTKAAVASASKTITGSTIALNKYFKDNHTVIYTGSGGTLTVRLDAVPTATAEPVALQTILTTETGRGYTALPAVTLAEPAANGTRATASAIATVVSAKIASLADAGAGYAIGDRFVLQNEIESREPGAGRVGAIDDRDAVLKVSALQFVSAAVATGGAGGGYQVGDLVTVTAQPTTGANATTTGLIEVPRTYVLGNDGWLQFANSPFGTGFASLGVASGDDANATLAARADIPARSDIRALNSLQLEPQSLANLGRGTQIAAGWLIAPTTGRYTFTVEGDDSATLRMAAAPVETVALPAALTRVISDTSTSASGVAAYDLTAGEAYYFEFEHKEFRDKTFSAFWPWEVDAYDSAQTARVSVTITPPGGTATASQAVPGSWVVPAEIPAQLTVTLSGTGGRFIASSGGGVTVAAVGAGANPQSVVTFTGSAFNLNRYFAQANTIRYDGPVAPITVTLKGGVTGEASINASQTIYPQKTATFKVTGVTGGGAVSSVEVVDGGRISELPAGLDSVTTVKQTGSGSGLKLKLGTGVGDLMLESGGYFARIDTAQVSLAERTNNPEVAPTTVARATLDFGIGAVNLNNQGSGYSSAPVVTIAAPSTSGGTTATAIAITELATNKRIAARPSTGQALGTAIRTITLDTEPLLTGWVNTPSVNAPTRIEYSGAALSIASAAAAVVPITFPANALTGSGSLSITLPLERRDNLVAVSAAGVTVNRGYGNQQTERGIVTFSGTAAALSTYFSTPNQVGFKALGDKAESTLNWELSDSYGRLVKFSTQVVPVEPAKASALSPLLSAPSFVQSVDGAAVAIPIDLRAPARPNTSGALDVTLTATAGSLAFSGHPTLNLPATIEIGKD